MNKNLQIYLLLIIGLFNSHCFGVKYVTELFYEIKPDHTIKRTYFTYNESKKAEYLNYTIEFNEKGEVISNKELNINGASTVGLWSALVRNIHILNGSFAVKEELNNFLFNIREQQSRKDSIAFRSTITATTDIVGVYDLSLAQPARAKRSESTGSFDKKAEKKE